MRQSAKLKDYVMKGLLIVGVAATFLLVLDIIYLDDEAVPTPCTIAVEFVNKEYASHLQEAVLMLSLERVRALNGLVASACVEEEE